MHIESGHVYKIVNVKAGTVIDLSGEDNTSIIGYRWKDGPNQKWKLEKDGDNWLIRSLSSGKYLGYLKGSFGLKDGLPLAAIDNPHQWAIFPDDKDHHTYRIFVPGAPHPGLNVDLSDHGNPKDGTPITLWTKWEGLNQTWNFEKLS